jgi:hypothetical protein
MQRRPLVDLRQQSLQILHHAQTLKPHTPVINQLFQHPLKARPDLRQRLGLQLGLIEQPPPDRANPAIEARPRAQNSAISALRHRMTMRSERCDNSRIVRRLEPRKRAAGTGTRPVRFVGYQRLGR